MTWEETIRYIRTQPGYREVVVQSYLDEDLKKNAERFKASAEFEETLKIVKAYSGEAKKILDIGSGNGISAVSFALNGYEVTAVEPDPSETVGCGAIEFLKKEYGLANLRVIKSFGEKLPFDDATFDVVYIRQAMHHAASLQSFIREAARVLKTGGLLLTVRDHVIYGMKDKALFLETHPLQKFYGGENAFQPEEYESAMSDAGLRVVKRLKYYDSVINYFPSGQKEVENAPKIMKENFRLSMQKRFGSWVFYFPFLQLLELISRLVNGKWTDERRVPGRMNSFIALKNPQ